VALAEPIRVLVCDDHELFRRGLRMVLEAEEGIEVVAEAADGAEAVARVEDLAPDVVLMDVRMPRMGGIEATREIRRRFPMTRIIVLSVSDEEDDLYGAFKAGANGYLLKEVSIEEVADAARAVASGRTLLAPAVAANLLDRSATDGQGDGRLAHGGPGPVRGRGGLPARCPREHGSQPPGKRAGEVSGRALMPAFSGWLTASWAKAGFYGSAVAVGIFVVRVLGEPWTSLSPVFPDSYSYLEVADRKSVV
jgi:DNA-binding NarL/FixJ family response regulator